eukprot:TRINITY_DN5916_c0_g1_i1.p2 TRINITY_DN5916_c0_g1~~TRINITY_DN5916_c0_g1_i1.p2  ORF type:complete len:310 (+),score=92.99 TRINITY_DN5916_c0_g1_i1:41-931(+)
MTSRTSSLLIESFDGRFSTTVDADKVPSSVASLLALPAFAQHADAKLVTPDGRVCSGNDTIAPTITRLTILLPRARRPIVSTSLSAEAAAPPQRPAAAAATSINDVVTSFMQQFNAARSGTPAAEPVPQEEPAADTYDVVLPDVAADELGMMISMGFDEQRARKALLLARNSLENAIEWIGEHQDDADIDNPLTFAQLRALGAIRMKKPTIPTPDDVERATEHGICTLAVSGRTFCPQPWFSCKTCNLVDSDGCCASCADRCHRGHDLEAKGHSERFYCDCPIKCGSSCVALGEFQ